MSGIENNGRGTQPAQGTVRDGLIEALVCLLAAVVLTWPMVLHFGQLLGGDPGDPVQTLWSWQWLHDAVTSFRNPFFSDRLFHPHGATLVFQTFDLPTALLAIPLWWVLPPVAIYNAGVLFAFWLSSFGMVRLVRELSGGHRLVALCAGVMFSATPYHLAHASHQHLASMGWIPLYLVHLHRLMEGRAGRRDAVLGGVFLGLAALASWYHLLYAVCATPVLLVHAAIRRRRVIFSRGFLIRAAILGGAFLVVAGPLLLAVFHVRSHEPVLGAHDGVRYSADLQSFVFPADSQRWSEAWGHRAARWTAGGENAIYAGWIALGLALLGAVMGGAVARVYLVVAVLGSVLALGPHLHIGGKVLLDTHLPYAWLCRLLPQLEFMGAPVRIGYLVYLGLLTAGAIGLAAVTRRLRSAAAKVLPRPVAAVVAAAVAIVPCAAVVAEYAPKPITLSRLAVPTPMTAWSRNQERFAVLDLSGYYRMMWHSLVHRHPMLWGNLSRVPARVETWYQGLQSVRGFRRAPQETVAVERVDPFIDFTWGAGAPDPSMMAGASFRATWTGSLTVPADGSWTFSLSGRGAATLALDGRVVLDRGGHDGTQSSQTLSLTAGAHALQLSYLADGGDARIRLEWSGPGQQSAPVTASAFVSGAGQPGLQARYTQTLARCRIDGRAALDELAALDVRHVVTREDAAYCAEMVSGLVETYRGQGVRIYDVVTSPAGRSSGNNAIPHR